MRDKGLVFEELRRQRRTWRPSPREASAAWLLALGVLFVLAGLLHASRIARAKVTADHPSRWAAHELREPAEHRSGGGHAPKAK